MERPSWDEYFMDIVSLVARRSTCLRRNVGAVLVKDKRLLTTGYNGAPSGLRHCLETGCLREQMNISSGERHELCRGLHAEQNAIAWAARHGIPLAGSTCYLSSYTPCLACANLLVQIGCVRVVYRTLYRDDRALGVLRAAGIELSQFDGKLVNPEEAIAWHDEAVAQGKAEAAARSASES